MCVGHGPMVAFYKVAAGLVNDSAAPCCFRDFWAACEHFETRKCLGSLCSWKGETLGGKVPGYFWLLREEGLGGDQ